MSPKPIDLSLDNLEKFVENNIWKYVRLLGGEPLLHPRIDNVFDIIKKCNSSISVHTNGTINKIIPDWINIVSSNKTINVQPRFQTFNVAPIDVGITQGFEKGCFIPKQCGMSFSVDGLYYCCGAGATVAREFNLNIGCKDYNEVASQMFDIVCRLCGHFKYSSFDVDSNWSNQQTYSKSWFSKETN
jgi:hypothetical protein